MLSSLKSLSEWTCSVNSISDVCQPQVGVPMVAELASGRTPMKWTDLHGGHLAQMKKCISAETINNRSLRMLIVRSLRFQAPNRTQ